MLMYNIYFEMKNVRRHIMIAFRGVTAAAAGDNIIEYFVLVGILPARSSTKN